MDNLSVVIDKFEESIKTNGIKCHYCEESYYDYGVQFMIENDCLKAPRVPLCNSHLKEANIVEMRLERENNIKNAIVNAHILEDHRNCTLDNFNPATESQAKIWQYLRLFTEKYKSNRNFKFVNKHIFILTGESGRGKTHLVSALLLELINYGLRRSYYLDFGDLKRWLQTDYRLSDKYVNDCIDKSYLVIDEIDLSDVSVTLFETFYAIIDKRLTRCKPTLLVSNVSYEDMENDLGEKLISRFNESSFIMELDGDDYRSK